MGTFREKGFPVAYCMELGITEPLGTLRAAPVGRAGVGGAAGSHWIPYFSVEQKLSGSHKALVEMQDVVAELLRSVPREHPATKVRGLWARVALTSRNLLLSLPPFPWTFSTGL